MGKVPEAHPRRKEAPVEPKAARKPPIKTSCSDRKEETRERNSIFKFFIHFDTNFRVAMIENADVAVVVDADAI